MHAVVIILAVGACMFLGWLAHLMWRALPLGLRKVLGVVGELLSALLQHG